MFAGCDCSSVRMDEEYAAEIPSPDGTYVVEIYRKQTGAGDPFFTYADLRFAKGGRSEVVLALKGAANINAQWMSNRELVLSHSDLEVVKQVSVIWGKHIEFRVLGR